MAEQDLRTGQVDIGSVLFVNHAIFLNNAALKDVLEKRGVLSDVQARIRAEVYKALQDDVSSIVMTVTYTFHIPLMHIH